MIKLRVSRETSMKQDVLNINSAIIGFWRQGASPAEIADVTGCGVGYVEFVIMRYKIYKLRDEGVAAQNTGQG